MKIETQNNVQTVSGNTLINKERSVANKQIANGQVASSPTAIAQAKSKLESILKRETNPSDQTQGKLLSAKEELQLEPTDALISLDSKPKTSQQEATTLGTKHGLKENSSELHPRMSDQDAPSHLTTSRQEMAPVIQGPLEAKRQSQRQSHQHTESVLNRFGEKMTPGQEATSSYFGPREEKSVTKAGPLGDVQSQLLLNNKRNLETTINLGQAEHKLGMQDLLLSPNSLYQKVVRHSSASSELQQIASEVIRAVTISELAGDKRAVVKFSKTVLAGSELEIRFDNNVMKLNFLGQSESAIRQSGELLSDLRTVLSDKFPQYSIDINSGKDKSFAQDDSGDSKSGRGQRFSTEEDERERDDS